MFRIRGFKGSNTHVRSTTLLAVDKDLFVDDLFHSLKVLDQTSWRIAYQETYQLDTLRHDRILGGATGHLQ
ncbi:hypothetical protein VTN77DRAFT_2049 [Rasamsonia byssochlamydoides]|uniref:uncharacterized protein n=1 Tax=Rasamsonia byssochlamydoides TaxID=89139 RepID=UPI0037436872